MKSDSFEKYVREQLEEHPSSSSRDAIKHCYQAAFGAEHELSDIEGAREFFFKEYDAVEPSGAPLCEWISADTARVSLGGWKNTGMPPEWLFSLFSESAGAPKGTREAFLSYLGAASAVRPEWENDFDEYIRGGIRAVHHSDSYRDSENPHYRIVHRTFARLIPILERVSLIEKKRADERDDSPVVIALDGRAASGKTTVAGVLSRVLGCDSVHMDDFFLPPELRTEDRYGEPGGNIHRERFAEEVLPYIRRPEPFEYRRFDCSVMVYGTAVHIGPARVRIVEGSYSEHPDFGDYADIKVFLDISEEEQARRIRERNGDEMAERFFEKWIPLEENFFDYFKIRDRADLVLD